ncbi:phage tail protein [Burkholderia pyrrocinia]|nr:phage tail protein [Burkholderia pyrrocinia]
MSVTAASASATFTADEIIVETALGGAPRRLGGFSKAINLATTGAGGMDTGSAPASGYVALYAIYNPTTQASALLATNATSSVAPNVYGGANMPSGYTASALVSVWPTNGSGQFVVGDQIDRLVLLPYASIASTSSQISTLTSLSISTFAPPNAKTVSGFVNIASSNSSNSSINLASRASGIGQQQSSCSGTSAGGLLAGSSFNNLAVLTPQTIYWSASAASGTFSSAAIFLSSYSI